jgi:tetratricopeptide (TPR) repeat protein
MPAPSNSDKEDGPEPHEVDVPARTKPFTSPATSTKNSCVTRVRLVGITLAGLAIGMVGTYLRPTHTKVNSSFELEAQLAEIDKQDFSYRPPQVVVCSDAPSSTEDLIQEARNVVDDLVTGLPRVADVFEIQGRFHSMLGEVDEAQRAWENCLQLNPQYGHALLGLGRVAAKQGQHQRAVEAYRQGLALSPNSVALHQELADVLLVQGMPDEAVRLLRSATDAHPNNADLRLRLGAAFAQLKDYAQAETHYSKATALAPENPAGWLGLANAQTRLRKKVEAAKSRSKFAALKSIELNTRKKERTDYDDLAAMSEDIGRIYEDAGRVYLAVNDTQSAETLFVRAAQLNPNSVPSRQALAWINAQKNNLPRAISFLRELALLEPNADQYSFEVARLLVQLKRIDEAESELKAICSNFPDRAAGFIGLADLYLENNDRPDQALPMVQRGVEIDPTAENYAKLAATFERIGNVKEANEAMNKAVRLAPSDVQFGQMRELLRRKSKSDDKK